MTKVHNNLARQRAFRYLRCQVILSVAAFIVLFAVSRNMVLSYSLLVGSLICIIPNTAFVSCFFSRYRQASAKSLMVRFYLGEMLKLLLAAVLFVCVLIYIPTNIMVLFIGFFLAQVSVWIAPLLLFRSVAQA